MATRTHQIATQTGASFAQRRRATPSDAQLDWFLHAGKVRGISCSGHALIRGRERFRLAAGLSARDVKFDLCEQVREALLAGRWSYSEPWWSRRPLVRLRGRRPQRRGVRWCWDARREHCFLLGFDASWKIITCLRRRRWAGILGLGALSWIRPAPAAAVVRLDPDGRHGLVRLAAFLPEIVAGRGPRFGAQFDRHLAAQVDLVVLDTQGAETLSEVELHALLRLIQKRLNSDGEIVLVGRGLSPALLKLLFESYGLRPQETAARLLPGETLRLVRRSRSSVPGAVLLPA